MALIAWRKWKAGMPAGSTKDTQSMVDYITDSVNNEVGATVDTDTIIANRITARIRMKIPCGTDMYD